MTSNASPLHVAVVIPCYNAGPWVSKTLQSALAQAPALLDATGGTLQVIAVDDGSTDDTLAVLQVHGAQITVETGPNKGACHARNRGFEIAVGSGATHVLFLDADDYLEGAFIAGLAETAQRTGAALVVGNMHLEYDTGSETAPRREHRYLYSGTIAPETFFTGWVKGDYVNPSGLLWDVTLVQAVEGWDESLARAQDLDITLRALLTRPHVEKSEEGAAIHVRVNPNSISNTANAATRQSRLTANAQLLERIPGTEFAPAIPHMCRDIYAIARNAFREGYPEIGRRAVKVLKAAGWRKHYGSKLHVALCHALGLERKVALTRSLGLIRREASPWETWSRKATGQKLK